MCLAIAAKVIELKENGKKAIVEQGTVQREVLNMIKAKRNEFVLVQQGFAVEKISEKEAIQSLEMMKWEE